MSQTKKEIPYPEGVELEIIAYKASGKYYSEGTATVYNYAFSEEFLQEIVDSQNVVGKMHFTSETYDNTDEISMYYTIKMTKESEDKYPTAFFNLLTNDLKFKNLHPVPMFDKRFKNLKELLKNKNTTANECLTVLIEIYRYLNTSYKKEKLSEKDATYLKGLVDYTLTKASINIEDKIDFMKFVFKGDVLY